MSIKLIGFWDERQHSLGEAYQHLGERSYPHLQGERAATGAAYSYRNDGKLLSVQTITFQKESVFVGDDLKQLLNKYIWTFLCKCIDIDLIFHSSSPSFIVLILP